MKIANLRLPICMTVKYFLSSWQVERKVNNRVAEIIEIRFEITEILNVEKWVIEKVKVLLGTWKFICAGFGEIIT